MKTIRIEGTNSTSGTRVFIDDVEQQDITRVLFDHQVGKLPYLRLDRNVRGEDGRVVIEGDDIKRVTEEYGGDAQP